MRVTHAETTEDGDTYEHTRTSKGTSIVERILPVTITVKLDGHQQAYLNAWLVRTNGQVDDLINLLNAILLVHGDDNIVVDDIDDLSCIELTIAAKYRAGLSLESTANRVHVILLTIFSTMVVVTN